MNAASDFVHLHTHGQHSLLDGLSKPEEAMAVVAEQGMPGLAFTDHGNLGGAMKAALAARDAGVEFWPGCELYLSIGDRFERNFELVAADDDFDGSAAADGAMKRKFYEHLTVIAGTAQGWRNLMLVSKSAHESFYMKPRADFDLLERYSEGLTVGTGCLAGPVAGALLRGDEDRARSNLARLVDIFGTANVFVEVMDHGIAAERRVIPGLVALAREFGLPVVATNDAHYVHESQAEHHDSWLCLSASKGSKKVRKDDPNRWRFNGSGYHLKSAAEMHELFDDQPGTQDAVSNTLRVIEGFESNIVLGSIAGYHRIPDPGVPDGMSLDDYFHARVLAGLKERFGPKLPAEVRARARLEEDVIRTFGVQAYFLVIADVIARETAQGFLVGAGRGSAPGSLCAYALGITQLDPLRHGLLFERFLNPDRAALPDVDTDFQSARQWAVIEDTMNVYGHEFVARIGTYGQAWAKDALHKMGRVIDLEPLANKLASSVPAGDSKRNALPMLLDPDNETGSELRERVAQAGPEGQRLIEAAMAVEGSPSSQTVHACGVVIGDEPLPGNIPLRIVSSKDKSFEMYCTEWDAGDTERAEFIKFDFLAIEELDTCAEAIAFIAQTTGEHVDFYALDADFDDERSRKAKAMLAAGRTAGVFQLSSSGMTELCRHIRPESAADLSALIALYRPGPMGANQHQVYAARRRGGEPVTYTQFTDDPAETAVLAGILGETMGTLAYQESLMVLARDVADFTSGQMSNLQKAFSKKKQDMMDALKEPFMAGGMKSVRSNGEPKVAFRRSTLDKLWRAFEASGSYLFNKSHSYAYGQLVWQTAYLKANWPVEYGAAMLKVSKKPEKRRRIMADLAAEGIVIAPPSVTTGDMSTSVRDDTIVLGLSEIVGVGAAGETVVAEREANGPFASLADLANRTKITSGALTALAEAGALDDFGPRLGLCMAARVARVDDVAVPDVEWGAVERTIRQRARLGVSVGEHPLTTMRSEIGTSDAVAAMKELQLTSSDFAARPVVFQLHNLPARDWAQVDAVACVASAEEFVGKTGRRLSMVVDSPQTAVEVVMWPNKYSTFKARHPKPIPGELVGISGTVRMKVPMSDDADPDQVLEPVMTLSAERLWPLDLLGADTELRPAPGFEPFVFGPRRPRREPDPHPQVEVETSPATFEFVFPKALPSATLWPPRVQFIAVELEGLLEADQFEALKSWFAGAQVGEVFEFDAGSAHLRFEVGPRIKGRLSPELVERLRERAHA